MQAETTMAVIDKRGWLSEGGAIDQGLADFHSLAGSQSGPNGWIEVYSTTAEKLPLDDRRDRVWLITIGWGC